MNSTKLQDYKRLSARVLIQYGNGYWDSRLRSASNEAAIFDDMCRLHYLYRVIDDCFLVGADVYIGDTVISDADVKTVFEKIQHYNGIYSSVDLSGYTEITPDDGDGGSTETGGGTTDPDHYRAGSLPVVAGANAVTFLKDGVPSPLASADYILDAYVIAASGQMQNNVVPTSKTAGGFVASDVLKAGTLYYTARLIT